MIAESKVSSNKSKSVYDLYNKKLKTLTKEVKDLNKWGRISLSWTTRAIIRVFMLY